MSSDKKQCWDTSSLASKMCGARCTMTSIKRHVSSVLQGENRCRHNKPITATHAIDHAALTDRRLIAWPVCVYANTIRHLNTSAPHLSLMCCRTGGQRHVAQALFIGSSSICPLSALQVQAEFQKNGGPMACHWLASCSVIYPSPHITK